MEFNIDDKMKIWQMIFKQYEREGGKGEDLYPRISKEDQISIYNWLNLRDAMNKTNPLQSDEEKKKRYLEKLEEMFLDLAHDVAQDIEKVLEKEN